MAEEISYSIALTRKQQKVGNFVQKTLHLVEETLWKCMYLKRGEEEGPILDAILCMNDRTMEKLCVTQYLCKEAVAEEGAEEAVEAVPAVESTTTATAPLPAPPGQDPPQPPVGTPLCHRHRRTLPPQSVRTYPQPTQPSP